MRMLSRTLVLVLALATAACSAGTGTSRPTTGRSLNSSVLLREEIESVGARNAYDAVRSLRPLWLRTRGRQSNNPGTDYVVVYLNNARVGPPSALQQISLAEVGYIQHFDAAEANYRFGVGHSHGAIQVITGSEPPSR